MLIILTVWASATVQQALNKRILDLRATVDKYMLFWKQSQLKWSEDQRAVSQHFSLFLCHFLFQYQFCFWRTSVFEATSESGGWLYQQSSGRQFAGRWFNQGFTGSASLFLLCLSLHVSLSSPGASWHWGDCDRLVWQPGQSEAAVEASPRLQESHRLHHEKGSWWRPSSVFFTRFSDVLIATVCTHVHLQTLTHGHAERCRSVACNSNSLSFSLEMQQQSESLRPGS